MFHNTDTCFGLTGAQCDVQLRNTPPLPIVLSVKCPWEEKAKKGREKEKREKRKKKKEKQGDLDDAREITAI